MVLSLLPLPAAMGMRRPADADGGDEVLLVVRQVVDVALAEKAQHFLGFVHGIAPAPPRLKGPQ